METLDLFRERARRWGRERFVEKQEGLYLVKRPTVERSAPSSSEPASLEFRTTSMPLSKPEHLLELGSFAAEWRAVPLRKKPENPFPERIGVGRAPNCDVVLRLSFVSKLHAHFIVEPGLSLRLVDLKSSNGTSVNGRRLVPNEAVDVKVGDRLAFGALVVDLTDAAGLYDVCTTEAQSG